MNSYKMPLCGVNLWGSERLLFFYLQSGRSHTVTELQSCAEKSQNVCALQLNPLASTPLTVKLQGYIFTLC